MVFGLAFFYAGQTNEKSVANTLLMSFGAFALVLPVWTILGHNIAFGNTDNPNEAGYGLVFSNGTPSKALVAAKYYLR